MRLCNSKSPKVLKSELLRMLSEKEASVSSDVATSLVKAERT